MHLLIILFCSLVSSELKLFTADINVQLEKPMEFTASPNGSFAAYTTRKLNLKENKYTYRFALLDLISAEETEIETGYLPIHDLLWTPDNDILSFIRENEKGNSVLVLYDMRDGSFTEAKEFDGEISCSKWGPSESVFAFSKLIPEDPTATHRHKPMKVTVPGAKAQIYDQGFVYRWGSFEDGTYQHVHFTHIKKDNTAPGKYVFVGDCYDLMSKMDGHCPERPFGGSEGFSISPDDQYIAFGVMIGNAQPYEIHSHIYYVDLSDTTLTRVQISNGDFRYLHPLFEPKKDWTKIIFEGTNVTNDESGQTFIYMWDRNSKEDPKIFNDESKDLVSSLTWSADYPDVIYAKATQRGRIKIVRVNATTGESLEPLPYYSVMSQVYTKTHIVMMNSRFHLPPQLYTVNIGEGIDLTKEEPVQVTFWNAETMMNLQPLVPTEELTYNTTPSTGDEIHGFYLPSLQTYLSSTSSSSGESATSYRSPLIMYIHGGPEAGWTDDWSDRWNPQTLTHMGYAVFAPNFHGSDSYNQSFTDSIKGHWGDIPYYDIENGTEWIINTSEKKSQIDGSRIGIMGASYGGYMMNWMQMNSDKYKAIICHDGLFDLHSFFEETDEVYFYEAEHYTPPWGDENLTYSNDEKKGTGMKWSPSFHVHDKKHKTPMLIFHGGVDYRVPLSQGIMAFHTLKGLGVPSRFVYFPDENHWVLNPYNSIRWHKEVLAWLKTYV